MNKYKQLASNTLIFAIGNFGSKLLSYFLVRFYTGILTDAEYGTADIVRQGANLLIPIVTLNIVESVMRYGLDKSYNKQQVYSCGIRMLGVSTLIMTLLIPLLNLVSYFDGNLLLLYIFVFTSSFRAINQQFLRTQGHVKLYAFDGILTTLLMVIFNVIFLVVLRLGTAGYLLSIILSDFCSAIFIFFVGQNFKYFIIKGLDGRVMRDMIRFSIPLIPTAILWWVVSSSDKFMIIKLIDEGTNGLYAVSYSIPTLISMVSTIFFQAWQMSAISEFKESGASKEARKFFSRVFQAYQSVMYVAAAGVLLLLRPLLMLLVDSDFGDPYVYTPMLLIAVLMSCSCTFLSYIYSATEHTKNSFYTSLTAALSNIILNIILIPRFGAQGAAVATMASYTICFFVRLIDSRRYIRFHVNFRLLFVNFILLLIMAILALVLDALPLAKYASLLLIFVMLATLNMRPLLLTVKRLLKR